MRMSLYTIYDKPPDFPDSYPVRRFDITGDDVTPGPIVGQGKTLEAARSYVPVGLHRIARAVTDHPTIIESWL